MNWYVIDPFCNINLVTIYCSWPCQIFFGTLKQSSLIDLDSEFRGKCPFFVAVLQHLGQPSQCKKMMQRDPVSELACSAPVDAHRTQVSRPPRRVPSRSRSPRGPRFCGSGVDQSNGPAGCGPLVARAVESTRGERLGIRTKRNKDVVTSVAEVCRPFGGPQALALFPPGWVNQDGKAGKKPQSIYLSPPGCVHQAHGFRWF